MTTYARLVDGVAVDIVTTPPALSDRFNAGWLASRTFYEAPDDTLPGRPGTLNGSIVIWGDNPTPPPPEEPTPEVLSASRFQDICVLGLGGNGAGEERFGAIIRAMEESQDNAVFSIYQRFVKSTTFDKPRSAAMFAKLIGKSIMTPSERTAILSIWPVA